MKICLTDEAGLRLQQRAMVDEPDATMAGLVASVPGADRAWKALLDRPELAYLDYDGRRLTRSSRG